MRRCLLVLFWLLTASVFSYSQNVFNPSDPIIRYKATDPLGAATHPNPAKTGLQKWVSVATNGVSTGSTTWDASSFKAYFALLYGRGMAFRLKFPKSYSNPDSAGKKYPVMLFFHGAGESGCPTNGGIYNNEKQLALGGNLFRQRVDNNQFDGFLLYPQMVPSDSTCWGAWGNSLNAYYKTAIAIIDSMVKYTRADIDRVFVDGLSAGGQATWRMAEYFPQRIASIAPSSAAGLKMNYPAFVHIPIWLATGGKDTNPSPAMAQYSINQVTSIGGYIKYTFYPDNGHAIWNKHWNEPGFVDYMNRAHKANPLIFFQQNEFCPDSEIKAHLGISPGFYAYEWQRNGVTIATMVNGAVTFNNTTVVSSFTGNEIVAKAFGTYRVRFQRTSKSPWSVYSPIPAVIGAKAVTATPAIQVQGNNSVVLPSLDGKTQVPLQLKDGYAKYEWYNASTYALIATGQTYLAGVGQYKAKVYETYGCGSEFSPVFTVVNANGTPKPGVVQNLTAITTSATTVRLDWSDVDNETGLEVYRSLAPNGGYEFVRLLPVNSKSFVDSNLQVNNVYYYVIRAVNNTGAAAPSNQATVKTQGDKTAPVAPAYLQYKGSTASSVSLAWNRATDNVKVKRYDVYVNGKKQYSTTDNFFTVYGLDKAKSYAFTVIAVDDAGNQSAPSNQVIGFTHDPGVNYKYYNGTYSALPNFTNLTPAKTGITDSILANPSFRTQVDNYAILYEANIYVADAGNYTFELYSDEGSKLYIDVPYSATATPVVNNDGIHTASSKTGTIQLSQGYHRITVTYFEKTGSEILQLYWWNDAGLKRERIYKRMLTPVSYTLAKAPAAPGSFTATGINSSTIRLNWTDQSTNESGFEIQRSTALAGPYYNIATAMQNAVSYIDSNLAASTRFYYKLRSVGLSGQSTYVVATASTALAGTAAPKAPDNLVGAAYGTNLVNLSWDDNSTNETGFQVWRSTGNTNSFTKIATTRAGATAYTDNTVASMTTYYYYIQAVDANNVTSRSNTVRVVPGNTAPVISGLKDINVKTGTSVSLNFTVTDNSGDVITVTLLESPSFVTLFNSGSGNYSLKFQASLDNIGSSVVKVKAEDDKGNSRIVELTVTVSDSKYRSVYINIGDVNDKMSKPWNNWLGTMTAGRVISSLLDENGANSGFSVTATYAWKSINNLGFNTGENTGVYPDSVLKSGISDTASMRQFVIKGLKPTMRYNIVGIASMNEGLNAPLQLVSGTVTGNMNARYNGHETGNLNGLIPDATGQIVFQVKKGSGAATLYLNGLVIEEYASSVVVNAPRNLYAEQDGATAVKLTWSDRSYNENSTDGFVLERALDSMFTQSLSVTNLPKNTSSYRVTGLGPNLRYWFRVRAKYGTAYSEYSNRSAIQTPDALVNINFNYTVANGPSTWNNLATDPTSAHSFALKTSTSEATSMKLAIVEPFNGEFNAGKTTGNNSGVVPDNVLLANYWLDRTQVSTMKISGLNHQKQYNFGFVGSSGPAGWYKGNYTATYTIAGRTVYLNSWENTTKIVYLNNVRPDENGEVLIQFSTTSEAAYGFNAGLIITEYQNVQVPASSVLPGQNSEPANNEPDSIQTEPTKLYPNPFTNYLVVDYYNKNASDKISTEVYDLNGHLINSRQFNSLPTGLNRFYIDNLGNANGNGMYILTIRVNGKVTETFKLLKRTIR